MNPSATDLAKLAQAQKQEAQQLIQRGRADQARGILEALATQLPTDAEIWFLLGLARGPHMDLAGAEQAFRACVKLRTNAFAAWDNLGLILLQQGKLTEAKRCFRTSIKLNGTNPIPHNGLGQLYQLQGDLPKSAAALREAVRINPQYAPAHNNLAIALRALNQLPESLQHARSAVEINPNAAEAWQNLGELLHAQADFEGALTALQHALQLKPMAEIWCSLGALMEELNRRDAAQESYTRAMTLQPENLRALIRLGVVLSGKGEIDAARTRLEAAVAMQSDHPVANAELANVLALQGQYQEAAEHLKPLLNGRNTRIEVALAYANISAHIGHHDRALALLEQLAGTKLPLASQDGLQFALAELYERSGQYERAFRHYQRAQTLRPLTNDLERHLKEMEANRTWFTRERLASLPHVTNASEQPLFIVGMPRSGTSPVEQILASHPEIYGAGELTTLWKTVQALPAAGGGRPYPDSVQELTQVQLERHAAEYLDTLTALSPYALRVTDKLPHNFLHLGLIELLFPQARVIHCVRDPRDTCLSIYFHRFNSSHLYARDLRSLGRYYRAYEQLMAHWDQALSLPIFTLRYEDLVEDVEGMSRKLVTFCGLEWDERCLCFHTNERLVNTPSHAQVRQPIYRGSLQRWRKYEPWIGELQEGLGLNPGHNSVLSPTAQPR